MNWSFQRKSAEMPVDSKAIRIAARAAIKEIARRSVRDDESVISSGLVDSLSVLKLIAALEQALSVRIPTTQLQPDDFDSVDVIVKTIERVVP
jgi:acyl carrier protein